MLPINELVRKAGDFGPIGEGLTVNKIIEDGSGGWLKVRGYATEREAQEKEEILRKLEKTIEFPEFLGRWRNFLVFRYLELDEGYGQPQDARFLYNIGKFLGTINHCARAEQGLDKFDREFEVWLNRLSFMRLIPPWIAQRSLDYYYGSKPRELPLGIDYWDAMPHNFAIYQGRFLMLDEKHLRPSYLGIGLVKPFFLLDSLSWEAVSEGYQSIAPLAAFHKFRPFLEFYYLVAAMYFYSLTSAAGRVSLGTNQRYLDYRDRLISIVSPPESFARLKNELHLYTTFPRQIAYLLHRRLLHRDKWKPNRLEW